MSGHRPVRVLFTGYAPVHFACFRPLFEHLLKMDGVDVSLSGGLRTKSGSAVSFDEAGLYRPFGIEPSRVIPTTSLRDMEFDVLFAGNTNMIAPGDVESRVQIFHGISFRNKAVRSENMGADRYFIIGPYMKRRFVQSGLMSADDPRALEIGFMKTDRLLNGMLDRAELLDRYGLDGSRPVVLYAPTGQKYNSLETMGEAAIEQIAGSGRFDLIIKPHDHPKNTDVDWFERLQPLCSERVQVTREPDVIPLLYVADVLITDASSVSSEYALLDRPMLFLDVPRLLERARRGEDSQVDLDTWGRHAGPVVSAAGELVEALDQSLEDPSRFGPQRRAMAKDLFFNPGRATDCAVEWFSRKFLGAGASEGTPAEPVANTSPVPVAPGIRFDRASSPAGRTPAPVRSIPTSEES